MPNTFEDYLAAMASYAQLQSPLLTDVQPGSVFRSLLEAVSMQMELIYFGAVDLARDAIAEAAFRPWGFGQRDSTAASGLCRFTITESNTSAALTIPLGTQVRVPGTDRVYRTTVQAIIPIASPDDTTVDILVTSIGAGSFYNTPGGTISEFVTPFDPTLTVTNLAAFTNGREAETDDERLQRFASFIRAIHRATAESLAYAAETAIVSDAGGVVLEVVADAQVIDIGAGLVHVLIANGTNASPSADLLAAANTNVQLYKAAGVTAVVLSATLVPVTISCGVRLDATHSLAMVQTTVRSVLAAVVQNLNIGDVLYLEALRHAAMGVPGVIDAVVTVPASNTDPTSTGQVVLTVDATITAL